MNRINLFGKKLTIDLMDPSISWESSGNIFIKDPNTVVYFGRKRCSVFFKEHDMEIIFQNDYDSGKLSQNWYNAEWVRNFAWNKLKQSLSIEDLLRISNLSKARGKEEGIAQAKEEIRNVLGIGNL